MNRGDIEDLARHLELIRIGGGEWPMGPVAPNVPRVAAMLLRYHADGFVILVEAPEGSSVVLEEDLSESLLIPIAIPGGPVIHRKIPGSLVVDAARKGRAGLSIRGVRKPVDHPEALARPSRTSPDLP